VSNVVIEIPRQFDLITPHIWDFEGEELSDIDTAATEACVPLSVAE
jgi:hypothetical protein